MVALMKGKWINPGFKGYFAPIPYFRATIASDNYRWILNRLTLTYEAHCMTIHVEKRRSWKTFPCFHFPVFGFL